MINIFKLWLQVYQILAFFFLLQSVVLFVHLSFMAVIFKQYIFFCYYFPSILHQLHFISYFGFLVFSANYFHFFHPFLRQPGKLPLLRSFYSNPWPHQVNFFLPFPAFSWSRDVSYVIETILFSYETNSSLRCLCLFKKKKPFPGDSLSYRNSLLLIFILSLLQVSSCPSEYVLECISQVAKLKSEILYP